MTVKKTILACSCLLALGGCANVELTVARIADSFKSEGTMPSPRFTQAWLNKYEPELRSAVAGSNFEFKREDNVLVVTAPVKSTFNPDRPEMLLPSSLKPITNVAKLLESDSDMAVIVLGHADSTGNADYNKTLSQKRASAVSSIFRMSGLKHDRLQSLGVGSNMPRAANDSAAGRELNRRVEIIVTARSTMSGLLAQYNNPLAAK